MQPKAAGEFQDDDEIYIPEMPGKIKQFIRIPKSKIPEVDGVKAFDHDLNANNAGDSKDSTSAGKCITFKYTFNKHFLLLFSC